MHRKGRKEAAFKPMNEVRIEMWREESERKEERVRKETVRNKGKARKGDGKIKYT